MTIPNLPSDHQIVDQSTGLATDPWWLFFDRVNKWIRGDGGTLYATSAQRTLASTRGYINPQNVADGTLLIETDTGLTYQLRAKVWVCIAGTQVVSQILTVASTTIHAPTTGAPYLIEIVDQDGTGGRVIVWDNVDTVHFSAASASLGTAAASKRCVFGFVLVGGLYVMAFEGPKDMTP